MNPTRLPYAAEQTANLILLFYELAAATARQASRQGHRLVQRRGRGRTLKPGSATPLWNQLVEQVRPHLARRGAKAQLARILGLPRQRLQDCLKAQTACLDSERTLLLLCWLVARRQGRELTA